MGLGRFMRDMFGEVSEPWVGSHRASQPLVAQKESTISSTDGRSQVGPSPQLPVEAPISLDPQAAPDEPAEDSDSGPIAKTLVMDPARPRPSMNPSDWQSFDSEPAASRPSQPAIEAPPSVVVVAPPQAAPVAPVVLAAPPQGTAPPQNIPAAPGLPSTRH